MDRQVIIEIKGIKKRYKLGQIGSTTLQHRIQSWWAKKTGKEDPNSAVNSSSSDHIQGDTVMALNGIDLTIYRGESIGIIGRNGRGKSTLLKLLSRVTAPTEGTIDIYGRIASMLEVGTGFDPELTGRENIYLNGAILGMTTEEIDSKMEQIIDFSEVRDFIDTPVKRYSSGMYSKLAFSVAAHLDSDIMIMDEVLAVGDAAFQAKCIEIMKRAVEQEGRTVLYVSHNMNQIRSLCSRCAVLHEGKIVFLGDTDKAIEIYSDNELKQDTDVSYTDFGRPAWIYDDRLRIVNARYTDEASIIFTNGRKANVSMLLHSTRDLSNVGLRVEVRNMAEFDRPIGIFVFDDICSMKKDEDVRVDLEYDLSMLVDGSYGTLYCFYEADEFGSYQSIVW